MNHKIFCGIETGRCKASFLSSNSTHSLSVLKILQEPKHPSLHLHVADLQVLLVCAYIYKSH